MYRIAMQTLDYQGSPKGLVGFYDKYGERHICINMGHFVLDWIGGEYADGPDEWPTEDFEEEYKRIYKRWGDPAEILALLENTAC